MLLRAVLLADPMSRQTASSRVRARAEAAGMPSEVGRRSPEPRDARSCPSKPAIFVCVVAAAFFLATAARAETTARWTVDWAKLADVIQNGAAGLIPLETPHPAQARYDSKSPPPGSPWLFPNEAVRLAVSLVARDWGGAQLLVGHLTLIDQLRLSRSSRMIVTRVRIAQGPIVPFVQAGIGQWRVDTELLPKLPRDVETAVQLGVGFEFAFSRAIALAVEADHTLLIRGLHEPQMVSAPYLWATSLAAKFIF